MNNDDIQTVLAVKQVLEAFGYGAEADDLLKIFAKLEQPEVKEKVVEKIRTVVTPNDKERAKIKKALMESGLYSKDGGDDFESLTQGIKELSEKFVELATSPGPESTAKEPTVNIDVIVASIGNIRHLSKMFQGTPTGDELEAIAKKLSSAFEESDDDE